MHIKAITTLASSLLLAGCVTTQGVTCDIHYTGPVPQHLVEAGRALNPHIVELPSDMVQQQCELTPVGCISGNLENGWRFVIVTDEPERWNLTRQEVIDHELEQLNKIV